MIQSGKYFPASTFVVPYQGQGMNPQRAASVWRTMVDPGAVDEDDIQRIFFSTNATMAPSLRTGQSRYFEHGTLSEDAVIQVQTMVSSTVSEQLHRALRGDVIIERTKDLHTDTPGARVPLWGRQPCGLRPQKQRHLGDFCAFNSTDDQDDHMDEEEGGDN